MDGLTSFGEVVVRVPPMDAIDKAISRHSTLSNSPISNRMTTEWLPAYHSSVAIVEMDSTEGLMIAEAEEALRYKKDIRFRIFDMQI